MLRKIFVLKRGEVTGDWRKLHNEELHDLYCSLNIIWVIKSRIMKWVAYVARTGEKRNGWHMWHAQGRREMGGICGTHRGEEKWVAYVARTGEKRNGWHMWHAQGRREMGGICATHRGEEKCIQGFGREN